MDAGKGLKRLERLAKSLLLDKEIPPAEMDRVRGLMRNVNLEPEQKYREIIGIVQNLPDKKVLLGEGIEVAEEKKVSEPVKRGVRKKHEARTFTGPTESSVNIDEIYGKFKNSKLFKKRYLVHRDNRFGIGFRKRLVPSKKFKQILDRIADIQELVINGLVNVLHDIMFDTGAQDPTMYNYLRVMDRWMADVPLLRQEYEKIIWLERKEFDRAFRKYTSFFFSFYKIGAAVREGMIAEMEERLAGRPGAAPGVPVKDTYRIITAARFFLPNALDEKNPMGEEIFKLTGMRNLADFLFATIEALVYQRPFVIEELISYYGITSISVDETKWDCSDELLERAGKDKKAKLREELKRLTDEYSRYETMMFLMNVTEEGDEALSGLVREYWRQTYRKEWEPNHVREINYLFYIYSVGALSADLFNPLLSGTPLKMRDPGREELEGEIFFPSYFEDELASILAAQKELRSMFLTKTLPQAERETVRRILDGSDPIDAPVYDMVRSFGEAFYRIAAELRRIYDRHRLWKFNGGAILNQAAIRSPLVRTTDEPEPPASGAPVPFFDCLLLDMPGASPFSRYFRGRRILEDSVTEGIFLTLAAFCFQAARECFNASIEEDIGTRDVLKRRIDELSGEINGR